MYRISDTIDIPAAEFLGKADGGKWVFRCLICNGLTLRKNRWTLAGAHICATCAMDHNEHGANLAEEYTRQKREERCTAVNAMYEHCDVIYPALDSPGGQWLYQLHNAITEAWEYGRFGADSWEHRGDVISEMADTAEPVYTYDRWQIFVDLEAWKSGVDMEDMVKAPKHSGDMTDMAGFVLREIAYQAFDGWLREKLGDAECDDCGEYPCECEDDESDEDE